MNSVVLIGRLTRDPELSYTPNTQTAVAHFSIAVDRPRRNGEDAGADFIRITVFGKQAETVDRYLSKGKQVAVQGRIQTGSYKNRDGVTVYTTDVIADRVEFLGSSQSNGGGQGGAGRNTGSYDRPMGGFEEAPQGGGLGAFDDMPDTFQAAEDDIPF
ncbi:MAG: single-stranded DNA-binding protein [Mogibacterium sp.]|nr:single-stranded DNA-binding protein [Mogibacterium sp.]